MAFHNEPITNLMGCEETKHSILQSQAGQAVLQYILMMIIVLAVLGGIVLQFNEDFRSFADQNLGDYLQCMIELGELPPLGDQNGAAGICQPPDPNFRDYASTSGSGGNDGGNTGSGGNGNDNNGNNSGDGGSGRDSSSSGDDGEGGGSGSQSSRSGRGSADGPSARSTAGKRFKNRGGGSSSKRFASGNEEEDEEGKVERQKYGGTSQSNDGRPNRMKAKRINHSGGIYGYDDEGDDDGRPSRVGVRKQKAVAERNAKIEVKRELASSGTIDDEELTLGDYMRYLIMAAMIIAILFLLGGQLLSASKEMD